MSAPTPALDVPGVLRRFDPVGDALPLMLDSPHSGDVYPDDFGHACPRERILWGEDAFVDDLFDHAPGHGAWLLAAEFPRTYIDANRALKDLDPEMIAGGWPDPLEAGEKTARGIGLIWKRADDENLFYDRLLTQDEVRRRIDAYWQPYQDQMDHMAGTIIARWGRRWHVNCHSMYSPEFGAQLNRPYFPSTDIILGDRDGTTSGPEFTNVFAEALRDEGLSVAINDQFKGVELVRRYGDPADGCHSVQIEIDRGLYMDEWTITKKPDFGDLRAALDRVVGKLAAYVAAQL
ncbi:MAG: N-formylglutamate amidohydrolase [Rhodospirillaceae bacterium]